MMKKILCYALAVAILCPAPLLRAADSGSGKQVKVILKDGSVVSGELLGIDEGTLMLQTKGGKSREIPVDKIKKAFDADGNSISLGKQAASGPPEPGAGSSLKEPSGLDEDDDEYRARRARRRAKAAEPSRGSNGLVVTGIILDVVGGLGFFGGLYMNVDGQSRMDSATSRYCPATVCTDGSYPYTIPGKKGYYKYSQYYEYYNGETERNIGTGVMVVGGVILVTGLILGAVGSSKARQDAGLMNLEDGKLAWSLPRMNYDPMQQVSELTLLKARF